MQIHVESLRFSGLEGLDPCSVVQPFGSLSSGAFDRARLWSSARYGNGRVDG